MGRQKRNCSFCGKLEGDNGCKYLIAGPTVHICNECVELSVDILVEGGFLKHKVCQNDGADVLKAIDNVTPRTIREYLERTIIGQDHAKTAVAVAVYNHFKRINNPEAGLEKSNLMLVGPTGCGKTMFARSIAKMLGLPFAIADATSLTAAGYVGDDVEVILKSLLDAADGDVKKAERGVVFIDEIDKLADWSTGPGVTANVGRGEVQRSLLKLLEGSEVRVSEGRRKNPEADCTVIKTHNILFIVGGAFVGLDYDKPITSETVQGYGMIPEFMGRVPVVVGLKELTRAELLRVLTEPDGNIVSQYQKLLELDGLKLEFEADALGAIVDLALANKTGARGLRSILEEKLMRIMFEAPEYKAKFDRCTITKDVITEEGVKACPIFEKSTPKPPTAEAEKTVPIEVQAPASSLAHKPKRKYTRRKQTALLSGAATSKDAASAQSND